MLKTSLLLLALTFTLSAQAETKVKNVLSIGDSLTEGTFGFALDTDFRDEGVEHVATFGVGGSIADWYLDGRVGQYGFFYRGWDGAIIRGEKVTTPRLEDLLQTFAPEVVTIELGTNYLWGTNAQNLEGGVRDLIAKVQAAKARCVWVGPPQFDSRYSAQMAPLIDRLAHAVVDTRYCEFVDSRGMAVFPEGQGDGIHFDTAGDEGIRRAKLWAKGILSWVLQ